MLVEGRLERVPRDVSLAKRMLRTATRNLDAIMSISTTATELAYAGAYDATRSRNGLRRMNRAALVGLLLLLSSCASNAEEKAVPTTQAGPVLDGSVVHPISGPPTCPPQASCVGGFKLADLDYNLSCVAVRPELVTGVVVGSGTYEKVSTEARLVRDADATILALHKPGGDCGDAQHPRGEWSAAFKAGVSKDVLDGTCRFVLQNAEAAAACQSISRH